MLSLLLAAAISYTLHVKDVLQPPKSQPLETWSAETQDQRQSVEFQTTEGTKIRGWLYKSDRPAAPFVIFFYGSNEDLAHEANRIAWLRNSFHVNAICFDYPGYGFSGGSVGTSSTLSAALQEFDYVRNRLASSNTPIISYGWSIGTGMAIHVAAGRPVAGLILQAPPANAEEVARWSSKHDVPWYGRGLVKMKVDPSLQPLYEGATAIRTVASPLLIIQGQLDDVVPIAQGREVFDASPATQKQFIEIPAAHHNDLRFKEPPASDAVGDFLKPFTAGENTSR